MTTSQSSPVQIDPHEPPLSAPLKLSFDYTRSVGPLLGQFFTALRERRIVGVRGSDGRVHVPPAEFDPVTYERLTEIVPVAGVGTVMSWTWQPAPLEGQPLDRPFAWALIKLDGADTPLLHAVDVGAAGSAESISTGARVHAHWVDEPVGAITDIASFALGEDEEPAALDLRARADAQGQRVGLIGQVRLVDPLVAQPRRHDRVERDPAAERDRRQDVLRDGWNGGERGG